MSQRGSRKPHIERVGVINFLFMKKDNIAPDSDNDKRTRVSDSKWKESSDERDKYRVQAFSDGTVRAEKIERNEDGSHSHTWSQYNQATGQYGTGEVTSRDDQKKSKADSEE